MGKGISKVSNLMRQKNHQDTQVYSSKPLQCDYGHKTFMTKFNLKRHNLTHLSNYLDTMYNDSIQKFSVLVSSIGFSCSWGYNIYCQKIS